ncbi:MAG: sigma-70 family RNA polymerase sigma factor [Thermoleophilia bacterium]
MTPADLTDAQLGALAIDGDRDAFGELFARHESGVMNAVYRMTGSREDAADITQEAFLRVFARLGDLEGREVNLAAYLHRTARNLVYDRSTRRARETPVEDMERVAGADTALDADPELAGLVGTQGEEVRAANARLPERHRLALALRELEGMGYEDIGTVLDITPGAVAQLLARARMGLRRELRLQQVDMEAMDPACRARLGDIAALIDGELDPDRRHVLEQHLELCASCREAKEAFEDAGRRYRLWLPLPLLLGLGAETARAAEARDLVRFADGAAHRGPAAWLRGGGAGGSGAGGLLSTRRRAVGAVGAGVLVLALLVAVPTLVATRSGSSESEPPPAAVVTDGATTAATTTQAAPVGAPAPATTTGGTTASAPAPAAAPPPAPVPPAPVPVAPGTVTAVAPAPAPTTARRPVTPPRPATTPTVTAAGTPPAVAPPPALDPAPPAPGTTTTADPPPGPNDPPRDPPRDPDPKDPQDPRPPVITVRPPPDIPFPSTFTTVRPPVVN